MRVARRLRAAPVGGAVAGLGGDRRALDLVYERDVARVHDFLAARCGSAAVADDLTTEVFINAAVRFAQGRGEMVTTGWLITVARRRLIDHWRRCAVQQRGLEVMQRERPCLEEVHDDGRLLQALDSLKPRERTVLALRYLDDHSVSEVAVALDVTYRAAESLLVRARQSFRHAYESVS